ncbi:pq loop repeat-containing protein [Curvularia clavata]|uniref:Pq loop repeat-containing protein n=1 Tax=Curvularia clavata TaxID=95742 RepID=A0A9Q8Z655_CURCL|nr:pq loop repeat-containing protein [Curvularia clavata]
MLFLTVAVGVFRLFHSKSHNNPQSNCQLTWPRIWHNWRRKSTEGLPGSMLILWSICETVASQYTSLKLTIAGGVPFGVYAIVQNFNFALKFQPQAFAGLTLISWGQTLYYHNKWRAWTATVATIALAASFGLMEMILILTLRGPYSRGVEWPMMLMAISATVIQILGLIPPYFELAKRNGRVIGIDFWFLTIDYMGAFFSLMAIGMFVAFSDKAWLMKTIVAQQWFDALGASLYIVCMLLETGIFASQAIWMWRVRHVRAEAKKAGMTYDEYIAENPSKKLFASESSETFVDVEAGHDEKRTASTCTEKSTTSQTEHSVITPGDAIPTPSEPSPEALPTPPPAVLRPSGPGP